MYTLYSASCALRSWYRPYCGLGSNDGSLFTDHIVCITMFIVWYFLCCTKLCLLEGWLAKQRRLMLWRCHVVWPNESHVSQCFHTYTHTRHTTVLCACVYTVSVGHATCVPAKCKTTAVQRDGLRVSKSSSRILFYVCVFVNAGITGFVCIWLNQLLWTRLHCRDPKLPTEICRCIQSWAHISSRPHTKKNSKCPWSPATIKEIVCLSSGVGIRIRTPTGICSQ